jgi:hypothetical protein
MIDQRPDRLPAQPPTVTPPRPFAERRVSYRRVEDQIAHREKVLLARALDILASDADAEARLVHEREGLDDRQVEALVAAHRDRRGIARSALAVPAGSIGQTVEDHPADVVARLLVLAARVAQADDDLHSVSRV